MPFGFGYSFEFGYPDPFWLGSLDPMARIRMIGEKRGRVVAQTERRPFTDAHMHKIFLAHVHRLRGRGGFPAG